MRPDHPPRLPDQIVDRALKMGVDNALPIGLAVHGVIYGAVARDVYGAVHGVIYGAVARDVYGAVHVAARLAVTVAALEAVEEEVHRG